MSRWGGRLLLATLVLAASSAFAAQGKPFDRLPPKHWAYESITRMEKAGYYTGAPKGAFATKQLTRYEFAVTTERIYRSMQTRALSAADPGAMREDIASTRVRGRIDDGRHGGVGGRDRNAKVSHDAQD